jgi:hypothetical protein
MSSPRYRASTLPTLSNAAGCDDDGSSVLDV